MCLLGQRFCHDKHTFVATKDVFCRDKHVFVTTKVSLSWQNFCSDKLLSQQNTSYVMTKLLLWQKWYLWQLLPMIFNSLSTNHSVTSERETDQHTHTPLPYRRERNQAPNRVCVSTTHSPPASEHFPMYRKCQRKTALTQSKKTTLFVLKTNKVQVDVAILRRKIHVI